MGGEGGKGSASLVYRELKWAAIQTLKQPKLVQPTVFECHLPIDYKRVCQQLWEQAVRVI